MAECNKNPRGGGDAVVPEIRPAFWTGAFLESLCASCSFNKAAVRQRSLPARADHCVPLGERQRHDPLQTGKSYLRGGDAHNKIIDRFGQSALDGKTGEDVIWTLQGKTTSEVAVTRSRARTARAATSTVLGQRDQRRGPEYGPELRDQTYLTRCAVHEADPVSPTSYPEPKLRVASIPNAVIARTITRGMARSPAPASSTTPGTR
jgi:hypothetical protein